MTALWVIGIANAVNLIDGLDGLAAGVIAIGSGALCIYGLRLVHLGVLPTNNIGPLAGGGVLRGLPRVSPPQLPPGEVSSWATLARMVLGLATAAATMEIGGRAPIRPCRSAA